MKGQFKLADKLGAARVAVLGPDEVAAGQVKVRNMRTHAERSVDLAAMLALLARFSGEPVGGAATIASVEEVFGDGDPAVEG